MTPYVPESPSQTYPPLKIQDTYFPYDLSASLGEPGNFENPQYQDAIDAIVKSVSKSGKINGIHVVDCNCLSMVKSLVEKGYNFIAISTDMVMFDHVLEKISKELLND